MNRDGVILLVEALGGAQGMACADALRHGAAFEIDNGWESPLPGTHFEQIYRRRLRSAARRGFDVQGIESAIVQLAGASEVSGLATISGQHRIFQVFLGDAGVAVACISVPQQERTHWVDEDSTATD